MEVLESNTSSHWIRGRTMSWTSHQSSPTPPPHSYTHTRMHAHTHIVLLPLRIYLTLPLTLPIPTSPLTMILPQQGPQTGLSLYMSLFKIRGQLTKHAVSSHSQAHASFILFCATKKVSGLSSLTGS